MWKGNWSWWRACDDNSARHMGCRGEIVFKKTDSLTCVYQRSQYASMNILSLTLCVFVCFADWQRMGSGALHAVRWCLPVTVLYNWPSLVPTSLRAPDNPAALSSCPTHTHHPGGEQVWPGATQRGVRQWWVHTVSLCLCHFFYMHVKISNSLMFFLFQRAVPVLPCLTASLLKPQPPCSTMCGRPSTA